MVETLGSNEIWVILVSVIPAVFLTLMLFLEHNMTTLIGNRKENKLKVSFCIILQFYNNETLLQDKNYGTILMLMN